jgi:hypothetical protein
MPPVTYVLTMFVTYVLTTDHADDLARKRAQGALAGFSAQPEKDAVIRID